MRPSPALKLKRNNKLFIVFLLYCLVFFATYVSRLKPSWARPSQCMVLWDTGKPQLYPAVVSRDTSSKSKRMSLLRIPVVAKLSAPSAHFIKNHMMALWAATDQLCQGLNSRPDRPRRKSNAIRRLLAFAPGDNNDCSSISSAFIRVFMQILYSCVHFLFCISLILVAISCTSRSNQCRTSTELFSNSW